MVFKPSDINRDHVFAAVTEIENANTTLKAGTRWEVIINGKGYPPKEVMRYARKHFDGSLDWPNGGGPPTNQYLMKMGFEIREKGMDPVQSLIVRYKKHISTGGLDGEVYKWGLLEKFKGRPAVDVVDFYSELETINFANLIYYTGQNVMKHIAKERPEEYRNCFRELFDESLDLEKRVQDFSEDTLEIYHQFEPSYNHHHDERTISTFLTFHNPEKYTFYKDSFYRKWCKFLNIKNKKKGNKLVHYYDLVETFIEDYIKEDTELVELVKSKLPHGSFIDSNHKILAQDILYQMFDKLDSSNGFNQIICELKELFDSEESDLSLFFNEPKNHFVCIFDDKAMNSENQHYEIIERDNRFYIELHFEHKLKKEQMQYYNQSIELPEEVEWFDWEKGTSIRLKESFNSDSDELISELYNGLILFYTLLNPLFNPSDMSKNNISNYSLNQILYGPPGTGKTYATKDLAVKIANPKFEIDNTLPEVEQRLQVTKEYQRLYEAGQIVFTTFHQSMSYEDFVEGIKPETLNNDVVYNVKPGLFKLVCEKAGIKSNSNFEEVLGRFKEEVTSNQPYTIDTGRSKFDVFYFGNVTFRINPHDSANENPNYPASIENLLKFYQTESIEGIYNPSYIRGIVNHLYERYGLVKYNSVKKGPDRNHVLIIDEINRGNVSAIFGELITLLEVDKRIGASEEVRLKLPYSKMDFGIPSNLYIIGTMNTADRSVEAIDTALRRRFSFVEVMPEPSFLSPSNLICDLLWKYEKLRWEDEKYIDAEQKLFKFLGVSKELWNERKSIWDAMENEGNKPNKKYFKNFTYTGFNLENILRTINDRIEALLDRDHTIGHSYFLKVNDNASLVHVFKNCIIPLLQEYFYGDYEKINLVLGDGFIIKDATKTVVFAGKNNSGYAAANKYNFIDLNENNIEAAVKMLLNFEEPKQKDDAAPAQ